MEGALWNTYGQNQMQNRTQAPVSGMWIKGSGTWGTIRICFESISTSLLRAFGAKVVYTKKSPASPDVETRYGVSFLPQDDLLAVSDIVSLHAPVNDETRYMVDASFLEKMKDTAYLINTSRGELVDSKALIAALESGSIAGAGLDTIDGEPVKSDNPLLQISEEAGRKLLLSCHIGGITRASFSRGYAMILEAIEKVSRGEIPDNIVG